jgi:hypothetical protein
MVHQQSCLQNSAASSVLRPSFAAIRVTDRHILLPSSQVLQGQLCVLHASVNAGNQLSAIIILWISFSMSFRTPLCFLPILDAYFVTCRCHETAFP